MSVKSSYVAYPGEEFKPMGKGTLTFSIDTRGVKDAMERARTITDITHKYLEERDNRVQLQNLVRESLKLIEECLEAANIVEDRAGLSDAAFVLRDRAVEESRHTRRSIESTEGQCR